MFYVDTKEGEVKLTFSHFHGPRKSGTTAQIELRTKDPSSQPLVLDFGATAICHPGDRFEKEKGRKLALTRALEKSHLLKETRKQIWQAYFARKTNHASAIIIATFLIICSMFFSGQATAQTLPTLPVSSTITGAGSGTVCSFESQNSSGGLLVTCVRSDGTAPAAPQYTIPSDFGTLAGLDDVLCLYWVESPGKNRLQCANGSNKVVLDGYIPAVTRKSRWHMFWW